MTTKEWLNRGYRVNKEINALIEQRDRLFSLATSITSTISSEPKSVNGNSSENKFINYASYSESLDKRIDELYDIKRQSLEVINKLDDIVLRTVLIERYINFKTWEQVAVSMDFTFQWVHILHKRALFTIRKTLDCS